MARFQRNAALLYWARYGLSMPAMSRGTSVPIPKFATLGRTLSRELRNRKDTSKH